MTRALRAVPRPARRGVPATRPGGTRCPPSATPAAGTCPRTSCTPRRLNASRTPSAERRAELRRRGGQGGPAQRRVPRRDVQRAEVGHAAAHRVRGRRRSRPATRGDEEAAAAWARVPAGGRGRDLGGQQRRRSPTWPSKAGYSRVGHHGGAAGRYVDAHDWVVASFFQHDSRDHDPQLHIHNAILNRVEGPDGEWRTLDGRSLLPVAAGRGRGRRADHRGAADPRARGAGRDPPGRQGPRGRRRRAGGDGPDLHAAPRGHREGRRADRRVRGPLRPRAERRWSATGCPGRPRSPPGGRSRTTARPASSCSTGSTRSCAPRSPAAWPASRDAVLGRPRAAAGAAGVVAAGGDRDRARRRAAPQGRLDPRRPDPRDQRRAARHLGAARRRRRRRSCSTGSPTRR